jgi:hypothetical protein
MEESMASWGMRESSAMDMDDLMENSTNYGTHIWLDVGCGKRNQGNYYARYVQYIYMYLEMLYAHV